MDVMVELRVEAISGDEHLSGPIAELVEEVRDRGLDHHVGPSGTTIVGDRGEVFDMLERCHEILARGNDRVRSSVQIEQRPSFPADALETRISKVTQRLQTGYPDDAEDEAAEAFRTVEA